MYVQGKVVLTAKGSSTGTARLAGLPAASGSPAFALGYYATMVGVSGTLGLILNNGGGNTTADIVIGGTTGVSLATHANFADTSELHFTLDYIAA